MTERNNATEPNNGTEPNDWTVMFFLAGDNNLSPSMVSQLKAIKDAGCHKNVTVFVRYDPNEKGARTSIFEVNRVRKGKEGTQIGDGNDPFVRNLVEDLVNLKTVAGDAAKEIEKLEKDGEDTVQARDALSTFLDFCRQTRPAKHYMLFLIGHGMIVANDAFLPDDNPGTSISLAQLGQTLGRFAGDVKKDGGAFELVGMHSCSMSGVEVAYQLKGTAKYMMATQGMSFVGSWPYRQLLKKLFNTISKAKEHEAEVCVEQLLKKLHYLCFYNSTDFMFAGFSADLALCSLRAKKVEELTPPLRKLTKALKALIRGGKEVERGKELVLLAHWESQSYYQENYTDLHDFCRCLRARCEAALAAEGPGERGGLLGAVVSACDGVMETIAPKRWVKDPFDKLVVYSSHFGPTYQYSHGVSIYFPWAAPVEDGHDKILDRYEKYEFTQQLGGDSWLSFLREYFGATKRASRETQDGRADGTTLPVPFLAGDGNASGVPTGLDGEGNTKPGKTSPEDAGGSVCNCGSIKNYPREFVFSPEVAAAFGEKGDNKPR